MEHGEDLAEAAGFFDKAIVEIGGVEKTPRTRVLDFGSGTGALVRHLGGLGYDAYGCDIIEEPSAAVESGRLRKILLDPYRLPFESGYFDAIVSTTVLEHAKNPEEYVAELHRVLKPGGCAMHLYPSKYYLPSEPHILVPFANFFYPKCPTWWFALWTLLGQRAPKERGLGWRETVEVYRHFFDTGVCYLSNREHENYARSVFGSCEWPMEFYIANAHGGVARLCRKLPFRRFWGFVSREFRMAFLVQRKAGAVTK